MRSAKETYSGTAFGFIFLDSNLLCSSKFDAPSVGFITVPTFP